MYWVKMSGYLGTDSGSLFSDGTCGSFSVVHKNMEQVCSHSVDTPDCHRSSAQEVRAHIPWLGLQKEF